MAEFDWDDEDLWDKVDELFSVRDLEPALKAFLDHLIEKGWTPPPGRKRRGPTCQACASAGTTPHQIASMGGVVTAMAHYSYYDHLGRFHSHDPNVHTMDYLCSNGHRFTESFVKPCIIRDCDHGEPT